MDRVLIVDSDAAHASVLKDVLDRGDCRVVVCRDHEDALDELRKHTADVVIIVFSFPLSWRNNLKGFCDAIRHDGLRPEVLCVLRWSPHGPDDRLFGYELDVAVIHER
jgi:DNA-binding response OmpR family regulator